MRVTNFMPVLGLAATLGLVGAGCSDVSPEDLEAQLSAPGSVTLAAVTSLNVTPTNIPDAVEGGTVSVDVTELCADSDANDVEVEVDWGDGNTDTRLLTPSATTGAPCGAGEFIVCEAGNAGDSDEGCIDWEHIYADNGSYSAVLSVVQPAGGGVPDAFQNISVTVANVAPSVTAFTRTFDTDEEGSEWTYTATISDPGFPDASGDPNLHEIRTLVWTFTPVARTLEPTTISCDCTRTGAGGDEHCNPGATGAQNLDICQVNDCAAASCDEPQIAVWLDDGADYSVALVVTDKDSGTTGPVNPTLDPTTVDNAPPDNVVASINGSPISDDDTNRTEVTEGVTYSVTGLFYEAGIDQLDIDWDFGDGTTESGTAEVTKASWSLVGGARIVNRNPADILGQSHAWDDNGAGDFDRTVLLTVQDDDGGAQITPNRFITVLDVDPVINAFTSDDDNNIVAEATTVTFDVDAVPGAPAGFDDLTTYTWRIARCDPTETAGSQDATQDLGEAIAAPFTDLVQVVSGCGDGDTQCVVTFRDGDELGAGNCVDAGVATYDNNDYRLTVEVADEDSSTTSATITTSVNDVAPSIGTLALNYSALFERGVNMPISLTVPFTDPAGALDESYTLSGDWGDDARVDLMGASLGAETISDSTTYAAGFTNPTYSYLDNKWCGGSPDATCTISVQVCEAGGPCSAVETIGFEVRDYQPQVSINEGTTAVPPGGDTTLVEGVAFDVNGTWDDFGEGYDDDYAFAWTGFDNQADGQFSGDEQYADRPLSAAGAVFNSVNNTSQGAFAGRISTLRLEVDDGEFGTPGADTYEVNIRDNIPTVTIDAARLVDSTGDPMNLEDEENLAYGQLDLTVAPETGADLLTQIQIDWGDGTALQTLTAPGDFDANGESLTVTKPSPYVDDAQPTGSVYTVTVTVRDEDSSNTENARNPSTPLAPVTTTLDPINVVPVIVATQPPEGVIVVSEGQAASIIVTADDQSPRDIQSPGGDSMLFTVVWDTNDAANTTQTYTGTLTSSALDTSGDGFVRVGRLANVYDDPGTYPVEITVEDKDGGVSAVATFTIEVVNLAPVVSDVFNTGPVNENSSVTVVGLVNNRGNDVLTYSFNYDCSATALSDFDDSGFETTTFGARPGVGTSAVGSTTHTDNGTFTACFRVCDDDALADSCAFGFTDVSVVNVAPVITSFPSPGAVPEDAATGVALAATATDVSPDDLPLNYALTCGNGTTGTSTGPGAFTCDYADNGVYTAVMTVDDGDGGETVASATVTVTNVAPTISLARNPTDGNIDETDSIEIVATGTDIAADQSSLVYRFDWGDGVVESGTTDTRSHTYANAGTYFVSVTVTDKDGGSATANTNVTVNNEAPVFDNPTAVNTVDEGENTVVTVDASDPDGDPLTYSFDFNGDGVYDVQGPNTQASWRFPDDRTSPVTGETEPGWPVTVQVCDSDGACITEKVFAIVNNLPVNTPVTLNVPSSVTSGSVVVVSANATDPNNDELLYRFRYQSSDGSTTIATVGPQTDSVATETITDAGSYRVVVEVFDTVNGASNTTPVTATANFVVTDVNVIVNVTASPNTLPENSQTVIRVSPNGVGPYTVSYDINGDGDFDDPEDVVDTDEKDCNQADPCTVTHTYTNNREGNAAYRVLVQITDTGAGDAVSTAITSVTVQNVAPEIDDPADVTGAVEGTEVTVNLTGSDVSPEDDAALTYSVVSGADTATITGSTFAWTPGYADEGDNDIVVAVTDPDGASDQTTFTVTVGIIDTNSNGVSDNQERDLNGGELLPDGSDTTDTDGDGVFDLDEVLAGTDPQVSDAPTAPVVISPDGVAVKTLTPTLTVANATSPRGNALVYTFVVLDDQGTEVGRESGADDGVEQGDTTTSVVFDAATLTEDAAYEWYALANDGIADGESSETASFWVNAQDAAPPAPENLTPADAAEIAAGTTVSLEARAVNDPDGDDVWYGFQVSTTDAFAEADLVSESELRSVPFYTVPEALDAGTYYWRAWATDGTNDSAFSTATSFVVAELVEVNLPPSAPTIVGPSNETVSANTATLEVSAATDPEGDSLQYQFELADNAAFAGAETSGSQGGLTWDVSDLAENTTHYWRARAYDGSLYSDWVSASFFVDAENDAPYGLALLSPADGSLLDEVPSAFVAQNATDDDGDALTYDFAVSINDDLSSPLLEATVNEGNGVTRWEPAASDLDLTVGETYYWGVTVSDGTADLVVVGSFTLADLTGGGGGTGVPDDGCGCSASHSSRTAPLAGVLALLGLVVTLRRRRD